MPAYYSAETGGFYDSALHAIMPADAVEITAARHAELMAAQGEGKEIIAGADGAPIAADPAPPSEAEQLAQLRRKRNQLLTACDWTQLADAPLDPETREAWAAYRQALRDLPETADDLGAIAWPPAPNPKG